MTSPVFPLTVFTDHHGNVIALTVGELHRPQISPIMVVIDQIEQNGLPLPAARDPIANGLADLAKNNPPAAT